MKFVLSMYMKYDRTDLTMHAQVKFDFGTDTNVNLRYIMSGKIMR